MYLKRIFIILGVILSFVCIHETNVLASAEENDLADEDDVEVDLDEEPSQTGMEGMAEPDKGDVADEMEEKLLKPSPDVDTTFYFTQPSGSALELPAGKDVQFLVGFANRGSKDFIVEVMDASFRYPLDFSFHIQNFSTIGYYQLVKPKQERTFYYTFYTSETFSSRPFGLSVNLYYKDADGNQYLDAVFNETVTIIEIDDSLDGETFFLYVFLAAVAVLLLVAAQQFLVSFTKRKIVSSHQKKIEIGTQNQNDVDYDWLPKETLNELNKSPRRSPRLSPKKSPKQSPKQQKNSPKQSPRQRRTKRGTGGKDE